MHGSLQQQSRVLKTLFVRYVYVWHHHNARHRMGFDSVFMGFECPRRQLASNWLALSFGNSCLGLLAAVRRRLVMPCLARFLVCKPEQCSRLTCSTKSGTPLESAEPLRCGTCAVGARGGGGAREASMDGLACLLCRLCRSEKISEWCGHNMEVLLHKGAISPTFVEDHCYFFFTTICPQISDAILVFQRCA